MLDNADYDSTNGSLSFDYHKLPGLRAELCKIRLITWKKKSKYVSPAQLLTLVSITLDSLIVTRLKIKNCHNL